MAKNKSSKQAVKAPQEEITLSDESLEQVSGGTQSSHGQAKGKGKKSNSSQPGVGGVTTSFGDGSVRNITDGTSNTIILGEK
jgi:hypothetical protein